MITDQGNKKVEDTPSFAFRSPHLVFREGPDLKRANVARIEKSLSEKKNQIALKPNLLLNRLNRFFTGALFREKQNSFFGLQQKLLNVKSFFVELATH